MLRFIDIYYFIQYEKLDNGTIPILCTALISSEAKYFLKLLAIFSSLSYSSYAHGF